MEHEVNVQNLRPIAGHNLYFFEIDEKAVVRIFRKKSDGSFYKIARMAKAEGFWVYGDAAQLLVLHAPVIMDMYNIMYGQGPY